MKSSLIPLSIAAVAVLSLTGCSSVTNTTNTTNSRGASNRVTAQTTVTIDRSLSMLPDSYLQANATVDKFLNAWLTYSKDGVSLLDSHARQGRTTPQLQKYFTQVIYPAHSSYEVVGYKKVSDTEYEFYVWMYGHVPGTYGPNGRPRPAPQKLVVVKQNNKWYIDNLPKVF